MNKRLIILIAVIVLGGAGAFLYPNRSGEVEQANLPSQFGNSNTSAPATNSGSVPPAKKPASVNTNTNTNTNVNTGILPTNAGVSGTITQSPCMPSFQASDCSSEPVSTRVVIYRSTDLSTPVITTRSNDSGRFSADLTPGIYVVKAGENPYPVCPDTKFTVGSSGYVSVSVKCDSGIRY